MTRPSSKPRLLLPPGQPLAPEDITVWNWPLRDEPLRSYLLLGVAAGLCGLVWFVWHDPLLTLVATAAVALSLWRLWLPVKWELGLTGITQTALGLRRRIPWMAIARFQCNNDGVWLFADRKPVPQRAVFIGYGGERERITACVGYYLGTWTSATDSTRSFNL